MERQLIFPGDLVFARKSTVFYRVCGLHVKQAQRVPGMSPSEKAKADLDYNPDCYTDIMFDENSFN